MDKSSPRYAAVEAEHLQNLASFVRRARRVREHSLVKDPALLNDTASGTMQVHATPNGVLSLVFVAPEEEQIESAAARVRPVILEKDRAFYSKALKAVRFLADPCSDELLGELAALRLAWKDATSRDGGRVGYQVRILASEESSVGLSATDTELAWAYIYGDTIHADDHELQRFGISQRFRAAAMLVCELLQLTLATLELIEKLRGEGRLELSGDAFEEDVIAKSPGDDGWTLQSAYLIPTASLEVDFPVDPPAGALILDHAALQALSGRPRVTPDPLMLWFRRPGLEDLGPCELNVVSAHESGAGHDVMWQERHGAFQLTVRFDSDMRPTGSRLELHDTTGVDPHDLVEGIRLFSGVAWGGEFTLLDSEGTTVGVWPQPPAPTVSVDNHLAFVEALVKISDHLGDHDLRVPQLASLTRPKVWEIQGVASLLRGERFAVSWTMLQVHLSAGQPAPTSPFRFVEEHPLDLELDGTVLHLGQLTTDWGVVQPGSVTAHDDHHDVTVTPCPGQQASRSFPGDRKSEQAVNCPLLGGSHGSLGWRC